MALFLVGIVEIAHVVEVEAWLGTGRMACKHVGTADLDLQEPLWIRFQHAHHGGEHAALEQTQVTIHLVRGALDGSELQVPDRDRIVETQYPQS